MFKKILIIFLSVLLIIPSITNADDIRCKESIDQYIKKIIELNTLKSLSNQFNSKNIISSKASKDNIIKILRLSSYDFEKTCNGVDIAYKIALQSKNEVKKDCKFEDNQNPNVFCLEDFILYGNKSSYEEADFKGEDAICVFNKNENENVYFQTLNYCNNKISLYKKAVFNFVKVQTSLVSKQSESNYYSAKLLSITQRLRSLGNTLYKLKIKITKVFESIFCTCNK